MSDDDSTERVIDAHDLIAVNVDFKKLSLFLGTVTSRLDALEAKAEATEKPTHPQPTESPKETDSEKPVGETENKGANKDIEALQEQIDDLVKQVAELKQQPTAEKEGDSFATRDELNETKNAVEAADAAIKKIGEELAKTNESVTTSDESAPASDEVEQRLNALEAMVDELKSIEKPKDLSDLVEQKANKDDLAKIEADTSALDDKIANTQAGVSGLNSRLKTLEGVVAMLQPSDGADGSDLASFTDSLRDLMDRQSAADDQLATLAKKVDDNANASKDRDSNLADEDARLDESLKNAKKELDELRKQIAQLPTHNDVAAALKTVRVSAEPSQTSNTGLTADDVQKQITDSLEEPKQAIAILQKQLASLSDAGSTSGSDSGISPQQFALLKGAVEGLENVLGDQSNKLRGLDDNLDGLKKSVATKQDATDAALNNQRDEIKALGNEATALAEKDRALSTEKADASTVADLSQRLDDLDAKNKESKQQADWKGLHDANRRVDDLQKLFSMLDAKINSLQLEKAPKEQLAQIQSDLDRLRNMLTSVQQSRASEAATASSDAIPSAIVDDINSRLKDMDRQMNDDREWAKVQLVEIKATVDHVHHSKADAALVANKAERDYVENAMEKLMREVEQVLNATNAGLIDTLDKSLNILRDMIDGKATKQDMAKLHQMIGEESAGNVPEGLTGYKSYRCLGCNRPMEDMRQRPMGSNNTAFINRIPGSNTRNKPLTPTAPTAQITSSPM